MTLIVGVLAVAVTQSGCVLPGGLRGVGGQMVDGRLVDAKGRGVPNAEIILVQGHFDRLDAKTAAYLGEEPKGVYELDRAVLMTDANGWFEYKFSGFPDCYPIWIIPPLLSLPSAIAGNTRHGTFFLLKTPEPGGQIYEIIAGQPAPSVVGWDSQKKRRINQVRMGSSETLTVRSEFVAHVYTSGYTGQVEKVILEIEKH